MPFKCPKCGKPLKRISSGRWECTTRNCPVIEVKITYNPFAGYKKKITKMDTVLYSKELEKEAK